jgi:hypothetical protein
MAMLRARFRQLSLLVIIAAAMMFLAGCSGERKVKVAGTVSAAGEPVVQGTIRFAPADGVGPTDGATIAAGRYAAEISAGPKTVQIEAFKKVGEAPHDRNDPSSPILPVYESLTKYETAADVDAANESLNFEIPAP